MLCNPDEAADLHLATLALLKPDCSQSPRQPYC